MFKNQYLMKNITIILSIILSNLAYAQFSCTDTISLNDGYTATGITTPGDDGEEAWVTTSLDCQGTGGSSSTQATTTCWNQVFDSAGDDYLFSYTTGSNAGESIYFEIETGNRFMGLMAFSSCSNTTLDGCLSGAYSPSEDAILSISLSNLAANETIYIGVGIWSNPKDLAFDVKEFTVTNSTLNLNNFDEHSKGLHIYPNPTTDYVTISTPTDNVIDYIVYNTNGQIVAKRENNKSNTIDFTALTVGTYLIKVKTEDGVEFFKKVLKK